MDVLLMILERVVLPALGIVLSILVPWGMAKLIKLLEKKVGLKLTEDKRQLIEKAAEDALMFAEQQAANALAEGRDKVTGNEKLEKAVDWAMDHLDDLGVDDVAEEALKDMIEAKVGKWNFS